VRVHAGQTADGEGLAHGVEQELALGAQVGRIDPVVGRHRGGHRGDLRGRCVHVGDVDEAGRHAEGAGLQRLGEQTAHAVDLAGRSRPALVAHDRRAQAAESGQGGHVAGRPGGVDRVQVLGRRVPAVEVVGGHAEGRRQVREGPPRPGAAAAVADDDGGAPLAQGAVHPRVGERREIRVRMDVDEAGGEHTAGGGDDAGGGRPVSGPPAARETAGLAAPSLCQTADEHDPPLGHADVGGEGRIPRAVEDAGVRDQEVEHEGSLRITVASCAASRETRLAAAVLASSVSGYGRPSDQGVQPLLEGVELAALEAIPDLREL